MTTPADRKKERGNKLARARTKTVGKRKVGSLDLSGEERTFSLTRDHPVELCGENM